MKIAIVTGYWSTNIGNSFFQLGAEALLRRAFPDAQIALICDQPGYYNVRQGNPTKAYIMLEHLAVDYAVILGPFLRPEYDKIWGKTSRILKERGVKTIVLSAGMMNYTAAAVKQYQAWLAELSPYILTTRDTDTFTQCARFAQYAHDGIDLGFFAPDFYPALPVDGKPYVILNFDQIPEPRLWLDGTHSAREDKPDYSFEFERRTWQMRFSPLRTKLSYATKVFPFLDALVPRSYPERLGPYLLLRTDHRYNPLLLRKVYKALNSFAADVPYDYLNLYANTDLTLSNRVHACVATLAYGNAAMLISRTPRARLLQRIGADDIGRQPVRIAPERIRDEKQALVDFLRQIPL